jgi:hypothetical protein
MADGIDFKRAILEYLRNPSLSPHRTIITCWDVSQLTDMAFAFSYLMQEVDMIFIEHPDDLMYSAELDDPLFAGFNEPLRCWDASSVTNMSWMFVENYDLSSNDTQRPIFNADVRSWNVSSVADMSYMFGTAE